MGRHRSAQTALRPPAAQPVGSIRSARFASNGPDDRARVGVDGKADTRRPGCLPLALLAGGVLSPLATAGQRGDSTVGAGRYPTSTGARSLQPRQPASRRAILAAPLAPPCVRSAPPRATALFSATCSNAAALADWCPGGTRCFSSTLVRSRLHGPAFDSALGMAASPSLPGNSAMVMVSGSGLAAPPPRPTPARTSGQPWNHASASNDFRFHKKSHVLALPSILYELRPSPQ